MVVAAVDGVAAVAGVVSVAGVVGVVPAAPLGPARQGSELVSAWLYWSSVRPTFSAWHVARNCSFAVRPTTCSARSWSFTPGSATTMKLPWRVMSGSATPSASTRRLMIFRAWSSDEPVAWPFGASTTDVPPSRSSPSCGEWPPSVSV